MIRLFSFFLMINLLSCAQDAKPTSHTTETNDPFLGPLERRTIADVTADAARALSSGTFASDRFGNRVVSQDLLSQTQCVIGLRFTKGGFGFGGGGGGGAMSCRLNGGTWSSPSYLRTGSFEFGWTIGVKSYDIAIFITDPAVAERYKGQGNVDLKAYAEAVAASADVALRAAQKYGLVMVLSNDRGLFAGVGISLSTVGHMPLRNQKVYGHDNVQTILAQSANQAPLITKTFNDTVRQFFR